MGGFRRLAVDVGSLGIKRMKAAGSLEYPLGSMMVRRGFATTSAVTTASLRPSPRAGIAPLFGSLGSTLSTKHQLGLPHLRNQSRGLFISVEVTPNPESLKFIPMGETFNITEPRDFTSYREASASPLAKGIFQIEGVRGVFIGKEFVSVLKDPAATWTIIKPQVYVAITNFMESGQPVILPESEIPAGRKDTTILPEDSEQEAMVKELLESTIRPGLQEDGGDVEYLGIKDGVVLLKLQGSCRTCPSSSAHIKGGVERSLTYWVPGITGVLAVNDDELEKLNLEEFRKVDQAATMAESSSTASSSQSEKAL